MSQPVRGLRNALKSLVPNWLANRLNNNVGFKVLWSIAVIADAAVEAMLEGYRAPLPGDGTPTALGLVGQSRGLIRGEGESDDAYAARLRAWLDYWPTVGSDEQFAVALQNYLGGITPLKIRIISRNGTVVTIDELGEITKLTGTAWNWDQTEFPYRTAWWSDIWIVIYIDARWPVYTSLTDTSWVAAWGTYDGFGVGHKVPRQSVDNILSIVGEFKGAHTYVQSIIFCPNTTTFNPPSFLSPDDPDGFWAWFSRLLNNTQIPARADDGIRYWMPNNGG